MIIKLISQSETQLGNEISGLLTSEVRYSRVVFVSAFVALRTILRIREQLLHHKRHGTDLVITVGIDLGGTSREVLDELLRWNCQAYIFHNNIARATFHPKIYLFESQTNATLFIGSNNLTDGGFYTNYEAATRLDFNLLESSEEYLNVIGPLNLFLNPSGEAFRRIDQNLIDTLVARGELPSEEQARQNTNWHPRVNSQDGTSVPASPFSAIPVPLPPLLHSNLRREDTTSATRETQPTTATSSPPQLVLVWRKQLTKSDALQVREGTAHVGGVRLTQARFETPNGQRIDQTTYFRNLFASYHWERETGRHRSSDQEHAFVPMRIIIRGQDHGIHNFEISHKPSGEAGQNNYTTILRWGHDFNRIIAQANVTDSMFSLYETDNHNEPFRIDITG